MRQTSVFARWKRAIWLVAFTMVCAPAPAPGQQLKRRPKDENAKRYVENCIELRLWRDKGGLHYAYLTDEPYWGNLSWELGELKLKKGAACRINVIVDDSGGIPDLSYVPRLAIDAGFTNVHVYVHWPFVRSMAEIRFRRGQDGRDEVVYGHVQAFSKRHPPKDI